MAIDTACQVASPWTTFAISISSAGIGGIIGGGVAQVREWWKERQQKDRVEKVLVAEILPQADAATVVASIANFGEHGVSAEISLKTKLILSQMPPKPFAYRSLIGQLPLLASKAAAYAQTKDILAIATIDGDKRHGQVFEGGHKYISDADGSFDDANDYIDAKMADDRKR